jgi:glycosyltransferase involved in cell wall biosynthesis
MRENARLFLFPSMHDDSPFAVVEALASGLPIMCLDRVGPPRLAGSAGVFVNSSGTPREVSRAIARALDEQRFPSKSAVLERAHRFLLPSRVNQLYTELIRGGITLDSVSVTDPQSSDRAAH